MNWLILAPLVTLLIVHVECVDVKVFKIGTGPNAISIADETQFKYPDKQDWNGDLVKTVDLQDEYDELVPSLPRFDVHKWGEDVVMGRVPIVTRPKPYWSTPSPRKLKEREFSTPASVLEALEAIRATRPTHGPAKTTTPTPSTTLETIIISDEVKTTTSRTTKTTTEATTEATTTTRQTTTTKAATKAATEATTVKTTKTTTERTTTEKSTPKPVFTTSEITRKAFTKSFTTTERTTTTEAPSTVSRPVWRNPNFINKNQEITVGQSLGTGTGSFSSRLFPDTHGKTVELKFGSTTQRPTTERTQFTTKFNPITTTATPPTLPIFNRPTPSTWNRSWSSHWKIGPNGEKIDEKTTVTETRGDKTEVKTFNGGIDLIPKILPPPIIHTNPKSYRGPTYNCRVLDAASDGKATADNDATCKLDYPGYPSDDTCRCTFKVEERDDKGCAKSFLYTCRKVVFVH
ncbi:unnamed protein product [Bursaphelenchus okinawaensis]|uniref:Uncharacterized protein n=1 Tax=Bursaphelenchus okinawaensis TaxID=465554 RepID=A0A811LKV2_9BILA|nr:unnamed protein product [Bursaphelenchus okinawaensis]CAG9124309.1 unnamed protein product [Bursaphelenchus okinawaensis]